MQLGLVDEGEGGVFMSQVGDTRSEVRALHKVDGEVSLGIWGGFRKEGLEWKGDRRKQANHQTYPSSTAGRNLIQSSVL